MIRTIIVDDEILSRIGLQFFLDGKDGITVAGVFGEADEAVKFLEENIVDVVLTDIEMSEKNGLEFIREIREKNLAPGIIIVSCHDDFSYAQEAISLGTDRYLLKHNITEELLIDEVKKVYKKTCERKREYIADSKNDEKMSLEGVYRVGVLLVNHREKTAMTAEATSNRQMMVHLMEEIVNRYQMGTLFAPYDREIFLIFQLDSKSSLAEREEIVDNWLHLLQKNIMQYLNQKIIIGVSKEYTYLSETKNQYANALTATEQYFFKKDEMIFYYNELVSTSALDFFSIRGFSDTDWLDSFKYEVKKWLEQAWKQQMQITVTKKMLIQNIQQMLNGIAEEFYLGKDLLYIWNQKRNLQMKIIEAQSSEELEEILYEEVTDFRKMALKQMQKNPLSPVLSYIDHTLDGKLVLSELAEMAAMSVPAFSKKFKEQTGQTVTQYINEKRIDLVKKILKQKKYSLEEIAEMTGFSNANYLLRVFKKTTGQTIGEYKKKHDIQE